MTGVGPSGRRPFLPWTTPTVSLRRKWSRLLSRTHIILAALFGLGLAAGHSQAGEATTRATPSAEPPSLWSIDTSQGAGATKRQLICAGAVIRQGLGRALPQANGATCALIDQAEAPSGVFTGRCRLGADIFGVHSVTRGDTNRDFTVTSEMEANSGDGRRFVSTQRYRQVLASCPVGWNDGDTAFPGDKRVVNALTGIAHPISRPIVAP